MKNVDTHTAGMDEQAILDGNTPENIIAKEIRERTWGAVLSVVIAAGLSTVIAFAQTNKAGATSVHEAYLSSLKKGGNTLVLGENDLPTGGDAGGPDPKRRVVS